MEEGNQENDGERIPATKFQNMDTSAHLEQRIVDALRSRGEIRGESKRMWTRIALAAVIAFTGGLLVEMWRGAPGQTGDQYLLLLYQPVNFVDQQSHYKEYGLWMKKLNEQSAVSGEALKDEGWVLRGTDAQPVDDENSPKGTASGFFIFSASSPDEALRIARSCPHLKHNGVVELRPLLTANQ